MTAITADIEGHSPDPIYAGQVASASGVNLGACDWIMLTYTAPGVVIAGVAPLTVHQFTVSLTHVDQSHVTYVFPDFKLTGTATVIVRAQAHYTLNGHSTLTASYPVDAVKIPDETTVTPPLPSYGYGIPDVDYQGPGGGVVYWTFFDPHDANPDTNTFVLPMNPNAMTSPFPVRQLNISVTTAVDGQVLLTEGMAKPVDWTFSGNVFTPHHYDLLRSWVYDRRRRVVITDHFGRAITCVMTQFDPIPKQTIGKYWRHTFVIHATVVSVGKPTIVPVTP